MNDSLKLCVGQVWLHFGQQSQLEKAAFHNRTNLFAKFKSAVKDYIQSPSMLTDQGWTRTELGLCGLTILESFSTCSMALMISCWDS